MLITFATAVYGQASDEEAGVAWIIPAKGAGPRGLKMANALKEERKFLLLADKVTLIGLKWGEDDAVLASAGLVPGNAPEVLRVRMRRDSAGKVISITVNPPVTSADDENAEKLMAAYQANRWVRANASTPGPSSPGEPAESSQPTRAQAERPVERPQPTPEPPSRPSTAQSDPPRQVASEEGPRRTTVSGFSANAYRLVSADSGNVMTLRGGDLREEGCPVVVARDRRNKSQRWYLTRSGSGYSLSSVLTGLSVGPGSKSIQQTFGNNSWQVEALGDGTYRISLGGKALDVTGSLMYGNTTYKPVILYEWNGDNNQRWRLEEDPGMPAGSTGSPQEVAAQQQQDDADIRKETQQAAQSASQPFYGSWMNSARNELTIYPDGRFFFLYLRDNSWRRAEGRWTVVPTPGDDPHLQLTGPGVVMDVHQRFRELRVTAPGGSAISGAVYQRQP